MSRSIWKGPFVDSYLLKKAEKAQGSGKKFGEYSPTRTYYGHAADKKAKRK
jgi:small subunit ribosomal protein S19